MKQAQIHFRTALIVCLSLFFFIPIIFAQEKNSIGKVVAIRGKVIAITPDLNSRELSLKAPVFLQDTIQTKQGRIQLVFKDNTLMTLGRNSEMKITKYLWKPGDTNSAMETKIQDGSFRIMGGAITRIAPNNFKTHATSGTIGIRGSMYAAMVKGSLLTVLFQGGKGIYVKNAAGTVNISRPGFATRVKSSTQAPEKPEKIAPDELIELENGLASTSGEGLPEKPGSPGNTEPSPSEPAVSQTDNFGDVDPLATDPILGEIKAPDTFSDISSIIDITELNSAQDDVTPVQTDVTSSTPPTAAQPEILSILQDLGFTGSESTTIPSSGLWVYTGKMVNTITNETPENMKFIVNWDNQRIIAFDDTAKDINDMGHGLGFGFGTVDSSGSITDIKVLGSDSFFNFGAIMALTGYETFGHFYGTGQEGLGLAMEGYDVNIQNQTDQEFWSSITAGTVDNKTINPFSGTELSKGFFVGIAEDMASPNTNRRIFYNANPDDFTLTINKDNGTFSGSMSGNDFNDGNNFITGLTIGGSSSDSVYIADKIFAASLSGSNVITIYPEPSPVGLKTYGNFMVTSDDSSLSAYTTWGYWEAAYAEPGTGKDYHIHVPGSTWIAGKQTPSTAVSNLMATSFTGVYTGKAEGVMFDSASQMTEMTNGITSLAVNFTPAVPNPVSGSIAFDQITLPVTSSASTVTTSGFNAMISGALKSSVNGTFYGPNADGIGGNFSAEMSDGKQYNGIFAGDR